MTNISRIALDLAPLSHGEPSHLAYAEWLASRPDLWCTGPEIRHEVYKSIFEQRQDETG